MNPTLDEVLLWMPALMGIDEARKRGASRRIKHLRLAAYQ